MFALNATTTLIAFFNLVLKTAASKIQVAVIEAFKILVMIAMR